MLTRLNVRHCCKGDVFYCLQVQGGIISLKAHSLSLVAFTTFHV